MIVTNLQEPLSMIKVDIVNEVSKIADITKVKAEVAVDAVFDAMRLSMQRGERIELRGFGVFQVKPRKRGIGRNPRTGKIGRASCRERAWVADAAGCEDM